MLYQVLSEFSQTQDFNKLYERLIQQAKYLMQLYVVGALTIGCW